MSVFDWDDHHPGNDAMPWMHQLRALNPAFRCTLFSVAGLGTEEYWRSHPDWVELVPHGWHHPHAHECAQWSRERTEEYLEHPLVVAMGVRGFKAPGWQISNDTYGVLLERGWWVADQHLEDNRRPADLPVYLYEDGDNWHGHVQNDCGNGLEETWGRVCAMVEHTAEFLFASEAVKVMVA